MKRFLLLLVFALGALTCSAQKAKSFFYEGIELHNVKGWTILPAKDGERVDIRCVRLPFQMQISKQPALSNSSLENYLNQQIEALMETMLNTSGRGPVVKEVSAVMDGFVNNIPAKYVDITYNKKVRQRIYAMNLYNCMITIMCTGTGGSHEAFIQKNFEKILSTFVYNPESGTHRLF